MRKILLLTLTMLSVLSASAFEIPVSKDSTKNEKFKFFIKGRIDVSAYYDSYATVGNANGSWLVAPARPQYMIPSGDGCDYSQVRYEIGGSRVGAGGSVQFTDKSSVDAYIEFDFMNQEYASSIAGLRLRHAYARLNMGNSSFLFGQTTHLSMFEEIAPNLVVFGGGSPYNVLSRPIQFRFSQRFSDRMSVDVALSMFHGAEFQAQANSVMPDVSARFLMGSPSDFAFSLVGGVKFLAPDELNKQDYIAAPYGGIMAMYTFDKVLSLRAFALVGADLSTLGMMGGYAPIIGERGYTAINTYSTWFDITSARIKGFDFGLFFGYQGNLGTNLAIDTDEIVAAGITEGLDNHWALAPRVWYNYYKLSFGLEYMFSVADWMGSMTPFYKVSQNNFDISNNSRVSLLARFTF